MHGGSDKDRDPKREIQPETGRDKGTDRGSGRGAGEVKARDREMHTMEGDGGREAST